MANHVDTKNIRIIGCANRSYVMAKHVVTDNNVNDSKTALKNINKSY